jgi:hypothetical protein
MHRRFTPTQRLFALECEQIKPWILLTMSSIQANNSGIRWWNYKWIRTLNTFNTHLWLYITRMILPWLTVTEYMCHRWPRISSVCHNHNMVLSSFMANYRVCNIGNTTGPTSAAGNAKPSVHQFFFALFFFLWEGGRVTRSWVFCIMFSRSLVVL